MKLNINFLIDPSATMLPFLSKLGSNMNHLIDALKTLSYDQINLSLYMPKEENKCLEIYNSQMFNLNENLFGLAKEISTINTKKEFDDEDIIDFINMYYEQTDFKNNINIITILFTNKKLEICDLEIIKNIEEDNGLVFIVSSACLDSMHEKLYLFNKDVSFIDDLEIKELLLEIVSAITFSQ